MDLVPQMWEQMKHKLRPHLGIPDVQRKGAVGTSFQKICKRRQSDCLVGRI